MSTLSKVRKFKKQYCKDVKGSYAKMRAACRAYVEKARKSAKRGNKGKAAASARKEALAIIKGSCSLR